MARKKKALSGPNKSNLISYGDTLTALLAFYIVLNSLAKEQTGANIHAGTGSFISVTDSLGLPGIFGKDMSRYPLQFHEPSPLYIVPDRDDLGNASGPDDVPDTTWVRDREQEEFERFLLEIDRLHHVQQLAEATGEVTFDRMSRLPQEPPLLDQQMREMMIPLAPLLNRPDYEIEIVVWSTTPSKSAWKRSVRQANELRNEAVRLLRKGVTSDRSALVQSLAHDSEQTAPGGLLGFGPQDSQKLIATGKPWMYSDVKRPAASVTVRRLRKRD